MDTSTPVSPDDQALVFDGLGRFFVVSIVGAISETGLWTVYLVLFSSSMRLQISRKRLRSPANVLLLLLTVALFSTSTALWAMNVSQLTIATKGFFLNYPTRGLLDRWLALIDDIEPFGTPMEALFLTNVMLELLIRMCTDSRFMPFIIQMVLGDSVVIWRAWVLCRDTRLRRLVYIPMMMLLIGFTFMVIALECLSNNGYHDGGDTGQSSMAVGSEVCQRGEPIAWGISLATNFVSTCLIAVRAWEHRQFLRKSAVVRGTLVEKILIILTESGFIYCLFWLTQLSLFFQKSTDLRFVSFLQVFLAALGDQISGLYPTLIIIFVDKQKSISQFDSKARMSSVSGARNDVTMSTGVLSTIEFTPTAAEVYSVTNEGAIGQDASFYSGSGAETKV
ncbi:hypothetical protein AAF712_014580 [Marasmius tenuissimus]|uniref:Uncharacterized protein n=1 Tax=Marasmius tenuissimus TaxID=585030 RepID=A0ABR2ZCT9_9AGAR